MKFWPCQYKKEQAQNKRDGSVAILTQKRQKPADILSTDSIFSRAHVRDLSPKLKEVIFGLPKSKGLYLYGPVGCGKNHTTAAILRRFVMAGRYCKRAIWERLCLEIRSTFGGNGTELAVLKPYCDCDILVVEDIGTTTSINSQESDFNLRTLLLILDDRIEHRGCGMTADINKQGYFDRRQRVFNAITGYAGRRKRGRAQKDLTWTTSRQSKQTTQAMGRQGGRIMSRPEKNQVGRCLFSFFGWPGACGFRPIFTLPHGTFFLKLHGA